jgi:type II secretory pathway pseudopilin PulG
VVALVSLVLFATISWIGDVVEVNRVKSAAEQVVSALQLARQYAVSNAATCTVTFTGSTIGVGCSGGGPSEPLIEVINGATTSVPATPITFGPMGTGDQPGTIQVTYPGAPSWQVRVTGAGGIRACTPTCS